MACLNLSNGDFGIKAFTPANHNAGPITITRSANSIEVAHANFPASLVLSGGPNRIYHSAVFGGNSFVAVLETDDNAGIVTRKVYIVDFTGNGAAPTATVVHTQALVQSSTGAPQLSASVGSETLAFVFSGTTTQGEMQHLLVVRSDNGSLVMPGPFTVSGVNGSIKAQLTATELIIHHPNQFTADQTSGPRPRGECDIVDPTLDFGEAVLGAADPSLATTTRTATLRNSGLDCLTIQNIADNPPYALTAAARAQLPVTIDPGQQVDFDIVFSPAAPANNINRTLAVTLNPANGDDAIDCTGDARNAVASIATSASTLAFGTLVNGTSASKTFTVTNNGEIALTVTIAGPPGNSDFTWTAVPPPAGGIPLAPGATTPARTVTYDAVGDGAATTRTISVVPSAGATRTITVTGASCIPNAEITVPPVAPLDFAKLERGFRTVRLIEITNSGDDDLTFTARIVAGSNAAQAANFGLVLPGNDITDAPSSRNYSVLPAHRCGPGPTGNNRQVVAVSFHADGANGLYGAILRIEGHNATNVAANQTWDFPLSGEIVDPVPVDIALVLDRSGSMADAIGTRNKMEAALAGAQLLVQMLRDTAPDRCAIVAFSTSPALEFGIDRVSASRAAMLGRLTPAVFTPGGWTNIAGGAIVGAEQLAVAHPDSPPDLKKAMVVLTDGEENRCFQIGGNGPYYSITGRDPPDMWTPAGAPMPTDQWPPPTGTKVYAIGLGSPADIDAAALDQLSSATGGSYEGADDLTGKSWFLLEKYFTQIFMETAGLQQIQDPFYTINAGDKHFHEFDIFPGDVNCMVVTYDVPGHRLPFHVESPKGELISGTSLPPGFGVRFRSTPTARFVEITFPAKEPQRYAGRWRVIVEHGGFTCSGDSGKDGQSGFLPRKCKPNKGPVDYGIAIGAGSNLRLQPWVDPATTYVGQSFRLNATLTEAGLAIPGATVQVRVVAPNGNQWTVPLKDDGQHQDGQADDGDYGGRFDQTFVAGNYDLTFVADGIQGNQAFHREAHRTKPVFDKRRPPKDDGGRPDWCRRLWFHWVGKELREPKEPDRNGDGPERKRPKPKPKPKGTGSGGRPISERPPRKR